MIELLTRNEKISDSTSRIEVEVIGRGRKNSNWSVVIKRRRYDKFVVTLKSWKEIKVLGFVILKVRLGEKRGQRKGTTI